MMAIAKSRHSMRTSLRGILAVSIAFWVVWCSADKKGNYEFDRAAPSEFFLVPVDVLTVTVW